MVYCLYYSKTVHCTIIDIYLTKKYYDKALKFYLYEMHGKLVSCRTDSQNHVNRQRKEVLNYIIKEGKTTLPH